MARIDSHDAYLTEEQNMEQEYMEGRLLVFMEILEREFPNGVEVYAKKEGIGSQVSYAVFATTHGENADIKCLVSFTSVKTAVKKVCEFTDKIRTYKNLVEAAGHGS